MSPKYATIVATVRLPEGTTDTELIEVAVRGFLDRLGLELVPSGWTPDYDTVCNNITTDGRAPDGSNWIEDDDLTILDINPNFIEA